MSGQDRGQIAARLVPIRVTLDPNALTRFKALADRRERSFSAELRRAMRLHLEAADEEEAA